jgi:hypothetical protein
MCPQKLYQLANIDLELGGNGFWYVLKKFLDRFPILLTRLHCIIVMYACLENNGVAFHT